MTISQATGEGESKTLRVAHNLREPGAAGQAIRAAEAFATAAGLREGLAARLAIIVEELVLNVYEHGGVPPDASIELVLARRGRELSLILEDPGRFFDPREAPAPGQTPERGGGAGLALVKAWGRILAYDASGGVNRLELLMSIDD